MPLSLNTKSWKPNVLPVSRIFPEISWIFPLFIKFLTNLSYLEKNISYSSDNDWCEISLKFQITYRYRTDPSPDMILPTAIYSRNFEVDDINNKKLDEIPGPATVYRASDKSFPHCMSLFFRNIFSKFSHFPTFQGSMGEGKAVTVRHAVTLPQLAVRSRL